MNMLRSIREKKGLTVGQLAARASIPSRVLTEYEEGRQPIPLPHAKLIAKALWVQIEDLMPPGIGAAPPPAASVPPQPRPVPTPQSQATVVAPAQPKPATPPPLPAPTPAAPPIQTQREAVPSAGARPMPQGTRQGAPTRRGGGDPRGARPPRSAPPPPKPITEGQIIELARLAARMEIEQAKVEEQIGKPLSELSRTEAKDWIKRLRAMADEIAPSGRVRFGMWPGTREDREAGYLGELRDAGTTVLFKLFNGEEVTGTIADFTPYTITIKGNGGEETVLRKLALVYYRQAPGETNGASLLAAATSHDHAHPDADLGSDRPGEPEAPESDNMDEDRGV